MIFSIHFRYNSMIFFKYICILIFGLATLLSCSSYKYSLKHTEEVCFIYHPKIINDLAQDSEYLESINDSYTEELYGVIEYVFLNKNINLKGDKNCRYTLSLDSIINSEFTSYSDNISGIGSPRLNDVKVKTYFTIIDSKNNIKQRIVGRGGIHTYEESSLLFNWINVEANTKGSQDAFIKKSLDWSAYKTAKFIKKQSKQ